MALIKVPDGGFYVDESQVTVDYAKKSISIVGGGAGGGGDSLSLDGGTMNADAIINGTEELQITTADTGESGTVGITPQGVTIVHNTNSAADSSIKAIDNAIEIKANNTTVTVNGTGVALGGASVSGVSSITGQDSGEVTIETVLDMNNHKITNVANPEAGGDAMNKTTADTTYATKTEIADFITNDDLPVLATTSVAGIVKQGVNVPAASGGSDTTTEATLNALITSLVNAGIIASA